MEFEVLGPLQVRGGDDRELEVNGTQRRSLLLRLLTDVGSVVSSGRLIEDLWEGAPPAAASQTIQSHISNLRRAIGKDRIETRSKGGYRLVLGDDDAIDAVEFEHEVNRGRAVAATQPETAAHILEAALTRWRGEPYTDAADAEWAHAPRERLGQLRLGAGDDLLVAWLALGDHDRVVAEANRLIAEYPLHERLWAHLMLGLYRAGRQADALRAFTRVRELLADELGINPSTELVDLEQAILDQRADLLETRDSPTRATANVVLPTGVSTFLLTDIVGSTRIWEREPEAMGAALAEHDRVMRDVVGTCGGVLLKARGEGDSTFSVFTRASDAALAVLHARRALRDVDWPTREPLSVRMVLHTGEALERDGDYYGRTVNRAARLRSIAEGDRPLASAATAQLLADALPEGMHLVELGMRELRDLDRPELVYRLIDDHLPPAPTGEDAAVLEPAFDLPEPPRLRSARVFVGRSGPRDRLRSLAAEAERGERQLALIGGEPGIGKTSLAAEVALDLQQQGWLVLYGRCDSGLSIPYQPFVEALDFVVREAPSELVAIAGTSELTQVEPLLPSARDRIPGLPLRVESDAETDRYFVMNAAMRLLTMLGDIRPVALVLDDLHWADAGTLAMLRELASTASMRVLAIGTYRDSELGPDSPLTETLAQLRRQPDVERINLAGLDETELAALVAATAGHELEVDESTRHLLAGLRIETNGNPFFAIEILRYLASTGDLLQTANGRWEASADFDFAELPDSIREVVTERIARVGNDVGPALTIAAIIGIEFDLAVLAEANGSGEEQLLDTLELADAANLVVTVGTDRFAFTHALIANALVQGLSTTRRAVLHRKVAEAYEARGLADTHVGELAGHWLEARGGDAPARALEYTRRAGDLALDALAPHDALRWYRKALELVGASEPACRVSLNVRIGDALRQAGDGSHREVLLAAGRDAHELGLGDEVVRAALANYRGWASRAGEIDEERIALLESALTAVGTERCSTRAELLSVLAAELAFTEDYDRRRELADEALAIARELGDPRALTRVLSARGNTLRIPETASERDTHSLENMVITEALDDLGARWAAVSDRLTVAIEIGNIDEVDRTLAEEVELADQMRQPYQQWIALVHQSWRALVAGQIEESESFCTRALEVGTETGQPDAFVFYASQLFLLRDVQGRLDELIPAMEQSVAENPNIAGFRAALAKSYVETGQFDAARHLLEAEAATNFTSVPRDVVWGTTLSIFGEVAAALNATDEAAVVVDLLLPFQHLIATSGAHAYAPIALAVGRAAGVLGHSEGPALLASAVETSRRLRAPIWLARALVAQTELTGDLGPAEEALTIVERLGDTAVATHARTLLAAP